MVFFGWGFVTRKKYGVYMTQVCGMCNMTTEWHLYKKTTWFSMFFIPIIPSRNEHCIECINCGSYVSLSAPEFEICKKEIENISPETAEENLSLPYSGNLYTIQAEKYSQMIFIKGATEEYISQRVAEYGELSGNEKFRSYMFWLGKSGDWYIITAGETIDFYSYHNLVGWLNGDKGNPGNPECSIGYARHKIESTRDYIFYSDQNVATGDTEIGVFRNGESFFIYLPESHEEYGNLAITRDFSLSWDKVSGFIAKNGLDISEIDVIDFGELYEDHSA